MTAGDIAQFACFFVVMTVAASCLGCLIDRGILALRTSDQRDDD